MDKESGIKRLELVISKGIKHDQYAKTVEKAELYHKLFTGDGLDSLLKLYARREDDALFRQRIEITQHVVTTVVKGIMDVFYKVPRALYNRVLTHAGNDSARTGKLEKSLSKFYGQFSLDEWLGTRWLELNGADPNAFIVVEFGEFDNTKTIAEPYPFEVSSSMAVDYKYTNNILQYLIVKQDVNKLERYTLYLGNQTIVYKQLDDSGNSFSSVVEGEHAGQDGTIVRLDNKIFQIIEPIPHNAGVVPARRVGTIRSVAKAGEEPIYLSLIDAAIPYLKKSMKTNSELDLVMSNMAFPIKISYVQVCDACEGEKIVEGKSCRSCDGTGKRHSTSAMETIEVGMNGNLNGENMLNLEQMVAFKSPPTDIIKLMDEYVDKVTKRAKEIIFNSDVFTKNQIAETATKHTIDLQSVYDTLQPVFKNFSATWEHTAKLVASFTDLDKDLVLSFTFNKDAKLKTKNELLQDLLLVNTAGGSNEVRRDIQNDIVRITYSDSPNEYLKYQVKDMFNPFSGFSEQQITNAMLSEFVKKETKVLYYNYGYIFDMLEMEEAKAGKNFYQLDKPKQKEKIEAAVAEIMKSLESTPLILGN